MKEKSYKIDLEIYIVFIAVIGISVFNAIYNSIKISSNQDTASKILTIDIPSLQEMENMNLLIIRSKMLTTNWVYLPSNSEDKKRLQILQTSEYPELKKSIQSLMEKWKDRNEIQNMRSVLNDFEKLVIYQRRIMTLLRSFDDYEDPENKFTAEEVIENHILPKSANLISQLNVMIQKKKMNTDFMHNEMRLSSRNMMWNVLGIAILIVLVILIAAFYMSNNIIVPTMRLKNYILQMGKGEIPEMNIRPGNNAVGQMIKAVQSLTLSLKRTAYFAHEIGDGNLSVEFQPSGERDELGNALVQMRASLHHADEQNKQRMWGSSFTERINAVLRENTDDIDKLLESVIGVIAKSVNALQGGFYLVEKGKEKQTDLIYLQGSYAMDGNISIKVIREGEGLVGQAIKDDEVIYLRDFEEKNVMIKTGLSSFSPSHVLIIPFRHHDQIYGAVELSGLTEFRDFEIKFIQSIGETIGSTIASVMANTLTKKLLKETRMQAERLSVQEEELLRTNETLSNQSNRLQASEEELKQINHELNQKARELQQKNDINEQAKQALSIKAKELELNSKYKSEFLANMSHELRTPLNSVLILAKLLEENKEKNLSSKQTEYAGIIHKSGKDLLHLINDILDLSKIEAGKVELFPEETDLDFVCNDLKMLFDELAKEKQIEFVIDQKLSLPAKFVSDKVRLEQIIKNLLSNAFKFTPAGGTISLTIKHPDKNVRFSGPNLINKNNIIEFSVRDSGIGIAPEKQALIFEAFQQADGSISRSFGGTGLGLSISRMLVSMLGGEMQLMSEQGKGCTFFVFLPVDFLAEKTAKEQLLNETLLVPPPVASQTRQVENVQPFVALDDRKTIRENDKVLLIVEDDIDFAGILLDMAHERNFKAVIATDGIEGLKYAEEYDPSAIIMDMKLPGMSGWTVLNKIKANEKLCHIPIHIMSAMDRKQLGIDMGANAYLRKPLDKKDLDDAFVTIDQSIEKDLRHVLLIEDATIHQEIVHNLLISHHRNVDVKVVANVRSAIEVLEKNPVDCVILDLDLGNGPNEGLAFLEDLKSDKKFSNIPVIIFTGAELDEKTESIINQLSSKIVSKGDDSLNKLIEETDKFLQKISEQPQSVPVIPEYIADILQDKTVLIVDDDMRNIYALSNALEGQGMNVIPAGNGREAIRKLSEHSHIDIILMDIMMPVMNGFEAMAEIKKSEEFQRIPIICLTAKAMVGDREKCLQYGASDYVSKPVNTEHLFSLMRVWLYHE